MLGGIIQVGVDVAAAAVAAAATPPSAPATVLPPVSVIPALDDVVAVVEALSEPDLLPFSLCSEKTEK